MGKTRPQPEYHLQLRRGDVGRYVLLPGDPGRVPQIAAFFDEAREVAWHREFRTFTGTVDGIKVSCTSTGIGCPSAAIALEELIRVGADTFIRVGTAGSLQPHVKLGELCISTGAVREEGTSRQYVPLSYPAIADHDVVAALRRAAQDLGLRHHVGISHCKDAFYSEEPGVLPLAEEQRARWQTWQRANVLATAMEAAALFVVASVRKVRAGEILAVVGLTHGDRPIIKHVSVEPAIRTALMAVKLLAQNEPGRKRRWC